jgi:hypothetical protein
MTSKSVWTPIDVLQFRHDEHSQMLCAGISRSSSHRPCDRVIPLSEVQAIKTILDDMTTQMPDEIDHNVLLRLACTCLCAGHRGHQEASVIYRWTELMSAEAGTVRGKGSSSSNGEEEEQTRIRASRAAQPDTRMAMNVGTGEEKANELASALSRIAKPRKSPKSRPKLLTALEPASLHGYSHPLTLATPKPMELCDTVERDRQRWEINTSPLMIDGEPGSSRSSPVAHEANRVPTVIPASHLPPTPPDSASSTSSLEVPVANTRPSLSPAELTTDTQQNTTGGGGSVSPSLDPPASGRALRNPLQDLPLATPGFAQLETLTRLLHETREQHAALLAETAELKAELASFKAEKVSASSVSLAFKSAVSSIARSGNDWPTPSLRVFLLALVSVLLVVVVLVAGDSIGEQILAGWTSTTTAIRGIGWQGPVTALFGLLAFELFTGSVGPVGALASRLVGRTACN